MKGKSLLDKMAIRTLAELITFTRNMVKKMKNEMLMRVSEKQNVLLFLMSSNPARASKREIRMRQVEYSMSLTQILRNMDFLFWSIIVVDNTIRKIEDIKNLELRDKLSSLKILFTMPNSGDKNKGIGEFDMMSEVYVKYKKVLDKAQKISYFSGRKIMTSPYLLLKSQNSEKEVVISNPDFFYLNGEIIESDKNGLYNTMFFTMKKEIFIKFISYFAQERDKMINNNLGSEQILYNFIKGYKINYEFLNTLGLIRRDSKKIFKFIKINRYHIC